MVINTQRFVSNIVSLNDQGLDEQILNHFYVSRYVAAPAHYTVVYIGNAEPYNDLLIRLNNPTAGAIIINRVATKRWRHATAGLPSQTIGNEIPGVPEFWPGRFPSDRDSEGYIKRE